MYAHAQQPRADTLIRCIIAAIAGLFFFACAHTAYAATLSLSPPAGSYAVGDTVILSISVSSTDQAINAVSGTINFPEDLLQVVSISKSNSILTLWVQEPSYSNNAGTVDFAGVVPNPGFTGGGGNLITVRFRARAVGSATLSITPAETLANDGSGTNVLKGVSGATLTIGEAKAKAPAALTPEPAPTKKEEPATPEPIVELQAPIITSVTKSVKLGETAEVTGSSIYPGAIVLLTLQGNSGPPLTHEVAVGQNGVFSITQVHTLPPGDYIGSVIVQQEELKSPPSGAFVIRFEGKPLLSLALEFLNQPIVLFLFALITTFILGFVCGHYFSTSRRRMPIHDTLHGVDMEVHKAFLKLRERVNNSIEELEKESAERELTSAEGRFVREMTGTIKEAEKVIEKDIHDATK